MFQKLHFKEIFEPVTPEIQMCGDNNLENVQEEVMTSMRGEQSVETIQLEAY